MNYRIGLDVGSTTAKIAVLDATDNLIYSAYERHNAKVDELLARYLDRLETLIGGSPCSICVTGSVGMATARQLDAEFIQEVVAATVYAKHCHPEARALIDIGGEDAKVVFFDKENTELRMNGNCAGGTGAFIDQMAVLMGIDNEELNRLAMAARHVYPIAARCGVFAKTDIQNLMSRNMPHEDIAASIFHSVAVQTITTLSHGCEFHAPILLCGGPLTFLPALRRAFADYMNIDEKDFIVSDNSNLIPAMGCALRASGEGNTIQNLKKKALSSHAKEWHSSLRPLFRDEAEHEEWKKRKNAYLLDAQPMKPGVQRIVLGIDSGSTTTKIVALTAEEHPKPVFTYYALNSGSPINAVCEGLRQLKSEAERVGAELHVAGSCSTGYGEDLIKKAFNMSDGIIETMAHYRAASALDPDVSFILDIGGQDMKAIFVDHGAVVRMELNEACSSGCGTFIQTFATNLGYELTDFARLACTADAPCDLGTRCTVFMNSKVKQVLRDGADVADISAGLAYSVVKNCLYKVLKLRGSDNLGQKIVVQGGTMCNDSIVRAFEVLTGKDVVRSNHPELMGALGCAIHALKIAEKADRSQTLDDMLATSSYKTRELHCKGCENHCMVTQYAFSGGNKYFSGNKCERIFNNQGKGHRLGANIYTIKYDLLFDRPVLPRHPAKQMKRIGIPRVLNMYEDYPFWNALLTGCGFEVVLSDKSDYSRYEAALSSVMSDNICFPAKLVHSHIAQLEKEKVDRILMPYVVYEYNDDSRTLNSYNCPIVSGYSDVIRSSMEPSVPVDSPVINFSQEKALRKQIYEYLSMLGVGRVRARRAFREAVEAQKTYSADIHRRCREIYDENRREGRLTILLAGRPYHSDPLVQHRISEMIASLGVDVISDDIVRGDVSVDSGEVYLVKQWAYVNRIIKSGQWVAQQGPGVHFVEMTSFGCGPDAFIQDEIRDILQRHGKPFTLLKIDDVSNIGSLKLRVRSLVESLDHPAETKDIGVFRQTRVYHASADSGRKILAPFFTEYISPLFPALFSLAGYDVEVLPQSDQESVDYGLTFANNEICYPATLIVGDMIKALKSGRYDTSKVAVAMSQTGGQCRATSYAGIIKRAMIANGFDDVPLITMGVATTASEDGNEQEGFDIPWHKFAPTIVTAILYGDTISKMYHSAVVREKQAGQAKALRDKYLALADVPIRENNPRRLMKIIGQAAREFDAIVVDKQLPQVGVVGEIFLKFHPFAHQFVERRIMEKGIEVVPPLLAPFFLQEFVNVEVQKQMRLSCSKVPNFLVHGLYNQYVDRRMKKINKIASAYRYFRPFTNIYDDAHHVENVVSMAAQFGEGWLLPSDIIGYLREGVNNVISLQPFGCIANHIVSKGIEKKLHKMFPQLNMLSLDFDSGVSQVNVINRLLLFIDNIA